MALTEKTNSLARAISDKLAFHLGVTPTKAYDGNNDVYLSAKNALILFQVSPVTTPGGKDGIGITSRPYSPHVVKLGVDLGVKATGDITGATVVAGKTVDIGAVTYTAIAPGVPAAHEFEVGGSDAETMANLAASINADGVFVATVNATTPEQIDLVAVNYGTGGNLTIADGGTGEFTVNGMTGGLDGTIQPEDLFTITSCISRAGMLIKVYSNTAIAVADLLDEQYFVKDYRNLDSEIAGNV